MQMDLRESGLGQKNFENVRIKKIQKKTNAGKRGGGGYGPRAKGLAKKKVKVCAHLQKKG